MHSFVDVGSLIVSPDSGVMGHCIEPSKWIKILRCHVLQWFPFLNCIVIKWLAQIFWIIFVLNPQLVATFLNKCSVSYLQISIILRKLYEDGEENFTMVLVRNLVDQFAMSSRWLRRQK